MKSRINKCILSGILFLFSYSNVAALEQLPVQGSPWFVAGVWYPSLPEALATVKDGDTIFCYSTGDVGGFVFTSAKSVSFCNMSGGWVGINGASPAVILTSGTLSFNGFSFTTTTDDPTILVTGGTLVLRNCIIEASTGFDRAAVLVRDSGVVDAGLGWDLGGNTFICTPGDTAFYNDRSVYMEALGNWWGADDGPHHTVSNPAGTGVLVEGNVNFNPWSLNMSFSATNKMDIGIFAGEYCGTFEVTLRPGFDVNQTMTGLQFTIKWPVTVGTDVYLTDITYQLNNITMQTTRISSGGYYYYIFAGTPDTALTWTNGSEHIIMKFKLTDGGSGLSTLQIAADDFTIANNGDYYSEFWGNSQTGMIYHQAENAHMNCGVYAKVNLQGPYNTSLHLMDKGILNNNGVPSSQPYNTAPWLYPGLEMVTTLPSNMVDWVLVELRDSSDNITRVDRRAGLLLENGTLADTNGIPPLYFRNFKAGSQYFLTVYHRNHMPVMSGSPITMPNSLLSLFDFTINPSGHLWGNANAVFPVETEIFAMIVGDINQDGVLKYSGINNDRGLIINKIASITDPVFLNSTISGYYREDLNMNYQVKYSGIGNDQAVIFSNIDYFTNPSYLNTVFNCPVPASSAKHEMAAQSYHDGPVDIFLKDTDTGFDIVLKSKPDILEGAIDNIQFSLAWKPSQTNGWQAFNYVSPYRLKAQGEVVKTSDFWYQTFAMVDWLELPESFKRGEELVILSISSDIGMQENISIAYDPLCLGTNGGFFVSVFGENKTGNIISSEPSLILLTPTLCLFPNPVNGNILNFRLNGASGNFAEATIFDILSRKVKKSNITLVGGKEKSGVIDISGLEKGHYTLKIDTDRARIAGQFIKP